MSYDAIDSLIFLDQGTPLDWAIEALSERFEDEVEDIISALYSTTMLIRAELNQHHDGRVTYSTGRPFKRIEVYPSTEPGENGDEVPVVTEAHVIQHPDYEVGPLCGGKWKDEQ